MLSKSLGSEKFQASNVPAILFQCGSRHVGSLFKIRQSFVICFSLPGMKIPTKSISRVSVLLAKSCLYGIIPSLNSLFVCHLPHPTPPLLLGQNIDRCIIPKANCCNGLFLRLSCHTELLGFFHILLFLSVV